MPSDPVVRVFRGVRRLGLGQQSPYFGPQLPLPLLHPAIAHRFVLAGIGLHLGAVQGDPPQFQRPRFQRSSALLQTTLRAWPGGACENPRWYGSSARCPPPARETPHTRPSAARSAACLTPPRNTRTPTPW